MTYNLACCILRDMPKCWSTDTMGLKPEYAKQLLENKLIEEVEPGRYRATMDGTFYGTDVPPKEWANHRKERKMYQHGNFTLEEIDLCDAYLNYWTTGPGDGGSTITREDLLNDMGKKLGY